MQVKNEINDSGLDYGQNRKMINQLFSIRGFVIIQQPGLSFCWICVTKSKVCL